MDPTKAPTEAITIAEAGEKLNTEHHYKLFLLATAETNENKQYRTRATPPALGGGFAASRYEEILLHHELKQISTTSLATKSRPSGLFQNQTDQRPPRRTATDTDVVLPGASCDDEEHLEDNGDGGAFEYLNDNEDINNALRSADLSRQNKKKIDTIQLDLLLLTLDQRIVEIQDGSDHEGGGGDSYTCGISQQDSIVVTKQRLLRCKSTERDEMQYSDLATAFSQQVEPACGIQAASIINSRETAETGTFDLIVR